MTTDIRSVAADRAQDIKYAWRRMRRDRALAITIFVTMGLGIGITSSAVTILHTVLVSPLPVRDQQSLVYVSAENLEKSDSYVGLPNGLLWELTADPRLVSGYAGVIAKGAASPFAGRDHDRAIQLAVTLVTGNFFDVLQATPTRGRLLNASDDLAAPSLSLVLSHRAWMREFGGDTAVVGRQIVLQGAQHVVVGIAPERFDFPQGTDAWTSDYQLLRHYNVEPTAEGGYWDLIARLKPGASEKLFRDLILARLRDFPSTRLGVRNARNAEIKSFASQIVGKIRPALGVLAAAAALVLLIACTNAAGLLLSSGLSRGEEWSLRAALGAPRGRVFWQMLTESALFGLFGGALGIVLSATLVRLLPTLAPPGLPRFDELHFAWGALAIGLSVTVAAALLFGVAPAVVLTRQNVQEGLRRSNEKMSARKSIGSSRRYLIVVQVALAFVVVTGAGLLARTLVNLQQHDFGFNPNSLLYVVLERTDDAGGSSDATAGAARHRAMLEGLSERLSSTPGILGAAATQIIPFGAVGGTSGEELHFRLEGQETDAALKGSTVVTDAVSENFLNVVGMHVTRGRNFAPSDGPNAEHVSIINEAFARQAWPGEDPIGKKFQLVNEFHREPQTTVVGVVKDARYLSVTTSRPAMYTALRQSRMGAVVVVRTKSDDPESMIPVVRNVLKEVDAGYGIGKAVSTRQLFGLVFARPRFLALVFAFMAIVSLALAYVGLYALLATLVRQRSQEIGVRAALGATPAKIGSLIVREALILAVIGTVIGLVVSLASTRAVRSVLFEVSPVDPLTLAVAAISLVAAACIAAAVPARFASRVDPLVAMRSE